MRLCSIESLVPVLPVRASRAALGLLLAASLGACGKKSEPAPVAPAAPPAATEPAKPEVPANADGSAAPKGTEGDAAKVEAAPDAAVAVGDGAAAVADTGAAQADAAPAQGDAVAPNPVDAACQAIVERSKKAREAIGQAIAKIPDEAMGPVSPSVDDADYGGCVGDGPRDKGAWAIELLGGEANPESLKEGAENGAVFDLSVGLVWVGPDGATQSTSRALSAGFFSSSIAFEKVHDFDRDGRPELVISATEGSPDRRDTQLEFYRVGGSGPERFWKDVSPEISGLEDIDGDGVLDLLHHTEFEVEQGMDKIAGFPGATHVVSIDKLERNDAAVKGYYLKKCPAKKAAKELAGAELFVVLVDATCAWLWGEDGPAVAKKLNALAREMGLGDELPIVTAPWLDAGNKPLVQLP